MKRYIAVIGLILLTACAPAGTDPYTIGYVGPLSGDAASFGQSERNAVTLAVEAINADGGINGKNLSVRYEDGACTGNAASKAAEKLINANDVNIILGGTCSGETLAMAPITERHDTILFSAFSTSPDITTAGDYVFRNAPSDLAAGSTAAEMLHQDGIETVAVLTEQTEYANAVEDVFTERFSALNGTIATAQSFAEGAKDLRSQLTKIKETSADAVIFSVQSGVSAGNAVQQARDIGITNPLYGMTVGFASPDARDIAGSTLNGVEYVETPGLSNTAEARNFLATYNDRFEDPANKYMIGARYDSVYLIADAVDQCGMDTDCIRSFLYDVENYTGTIGTYGFDTNGDVTGIDFAVKRVVNASTGEVRTVPR